MSKRSLIALSLLGIIVAVWLVFQTPLMRTVRAVAWSAWVHGVARAFGIGPLNVDNNVMEQLRTLQAENSRLKAEVADYQQLREQIGSVSFKSFYALPASISARPLDTFRSRYVINRGGADGIVPGAPVVIQESTLIGFIAKVERHTAQVQLLLHPSTSITVETVAEEEDKSGRGLLNGQHYTSLKLVTVPRDIQLKEGQPVVTVAKDNLVPQGLLIGTISVVRNQEEEAYQEADLSLPYQSDNLRAVSVLISQ